MITGLQITIRGEDLSQRLSEAYRLGEQDLVFGELLPEKPGWIEQQEYEERTSVGFHLERLTKNVGGLVPREFACAARQADGDE